MRMVHASLWAHSQTDRSWGDRKREGGNINILYWQQEVYVYVCLYVCECMYV